MHESIKKYGGAAVTKLLTIMGGTTIDITSTRLPHFLRRSS